ncbi:SICAvar, type I [Plasmodium knowlesi strain H]|uniref:SICAvar, type I n=3 Tax=Plasmodium knowlesi TaxID=5850 RepID=A0A5K1TTZ7_PLAKH|eukprot:XP_002258014.1 SICA antigen [Plasmodium knowlesi strain H]
MAAGGAAVQAGTADPCSGGQDDSGSEATRTKLKDAWDKKWKELTQNGQLVQTERIPGDAGTRVTEMLDDLKRYMKWGDAPGSASTACASLSAGSTGRTGHMKNICKVLVQIVNWMGNLQKDGSNKKNNTLEPSWVPYLRCVVGSGIILRILGNKCKSQDIMNVIFNTMKNGGTEGTLSGMGGICSWVKVDDMEEAEQLLRPTLDQWLNTAKGHTSKGGISGVNNVVHWFKCEGNEKQQEEQAEKEKGKCKSERIMDLLGAGKLGALRTVIDPLEKARVCIQSYIDNNSSGNAGHGKLCNRLQCIDDYLKATKGQTVAAAGQTTTAAALWNDVQTQVTKLATTVSNNVGSDSDADGLCKDVKCPNDGEEECVSKTTCNIMAKALKEVYKKGEADQEDYRIFYPTLRCVILNAFADKLKDRANEGGYACAVEEGIEGAFAAAQEKNKYKEWCNGNGKNDGSCQPCGKQHQVCTAYSIKGTTSLVSKVMNELNKNTTNIQKTLSEISNKVSLCDRMNCIIKQWIDNNTSGATTPGAATTRGVSTTNTDQFWGEKGDVMKLWNELAKKMKETNGKVNGQCDLFATDAEKWACKYLHAGFTELKSISSSITTNAGAYETLHKDPSFVQTMGCFLLHSYAKYMKDKATCNIEKGITQAFESWNVSSNGNCSGTEPCVPCQWNGKDHESCTIKTNGSTDPNYKVEEKLKDIVNEDKDTKIKEMLSNINKRTTLCDHMKCIASHLSSTNGQQKQSNTSAEEFWGKDVKKLWDELVDEMKKKGHVDGNGNGDCTGFDNPSAERACKYLYAAFTKLKELSGSTASQNKNGEILSKDPSFVQTMGCFLLHAYATHIKGKSTCVIDEGIKRAFDSWNPNNNATCKGSNGTEPCVPCKWIEDDYKSCEITTNGSTGTTTPTDVKTKVKEIVNKEEPNTASIIQNINEMKTLCDGLQCIASHLNSPNAQQQKADDFWNKEVKALWTDLSSAMTTNDRSGNGCGQMDNGTGATGGRTATTPERKACNYFHGGLTELYNGSTAAAQPSSSGSNILSKHPSLRQTMGCFLLKEYAKQMGKKSTCPIDSGLRKAFDTAGNGSSVNCKWEEKLDGCNVTTDKGSVTVKTKVDPILTSNEISIEAVTEHINERTTLCDKLQCATSNWFKNHSNVNSVATKKTWCNFWDGAVRTTLQAMFKHIDEKGKTETNAACNDFGDGNPDSVERKACNHITAGLEHINTLSGSGGNDNDQLLARAVGCIALNMYADKIINESKEKCPIHDTKIIEMFNEWNRINNYSCLDSGGSGNGNNNCFVCQRQWEDFNDCKLSVSKTLINTTPPSGSCTSNDNRENVHTEIKKLFEDKNTIKMGETLSTINKMDSFCTKLQCAAKQYHTKTLKKSGTEPVSWNALSGAIGKELAQLLGHMSQKESQAEVTQYCNNDTEWSKLGHTERRTNKAACLLFAAGLQHIYTHGNGPKKDLLKDPSFEQTMGCLFLKEYAKQLEEMAKEKRKGYSWVHPHCSIDQGIKHAFDEINATMKSSSECKNGTNGTNDCFVCTQDENDYKNCLIGSDSVKTNVESMFNEETNKKHMQQTLENTVCPILLTDLLTPFLPLAPVSIGLSAMAYYLWKYFGPLGKGGPRFRRSPTEIPGPSVQEQVLDHVQQDSSHEYQLVKERKPRSAPTRTKRSGRVNRRTIIEIHFEVLDECQKGDTQLNQKDFLELLVQEFMGSELMEEEQVPKEDVLMEGVPMEEVPMESIPLEQAPMERVLSSGSGLLV